MTKIPEFYWLVQQAGDIPAGGEEVWLAGSELEKLEQMHYTKRRADWRLGRWTAKRAVCLFLEATGRDAGLSNRRTGAAKIEIVPADDGAPQVYIEGQPAGVNISISHSGGMGFCLVSGDGIDIGCDVEKIEKRSDRFVSDYFTDEEKRAVGEREGPLVATLIWSAKESALKALRKGLVRDTMGVRVKLMFERGEGSQAWGRLTVTCDETKRTFSGWWRTREGFVFTIAADAAEGAIRELAISD